MLTAGLWRLYPDPSITTLPLWSAQLWHHALTTMDWEDPTCFPYYDGLRAQTVSQDKPFLPWGDLLGIGHRDTKVTNTYIVLFISFILRALNKTHDTWYWKYHNHNIKSELYLNFYSYSKHSKTETGLMEINVMPRTVATRSPKASKRVKTVQFQ